MSRLVGRIHALLSALSPAPMLKLRAAAVAEVRRANHFLLQSFGNRAPIQHFTTLIGTNMA